MNINQINLENALKFLPNQFSVKDSAFSSNYDVLDHTGKEYIRITTGCQFRKYVVTFADDELNKGIPATQRGYECPSRLMQTLFFNFPPEEKNMKIRNTLLDNKKDKTPATIETHTFHRDSLMR